MDSTKTFSDLSAKDVVQAGGKGASLGEMTKAGLPVPPGFVVLASSFEKFLVDTDISVEIDAILNTVDTSAMHTVEHSSEKIQTLILQSKFDENLGQKVLEEFSKLGVEYVAVRSSATAEDSASAAWAGQLETYLNTTKDNLIENIQKCWASLYTPRAIFYGFEKGFYGRKQKTAVRKQNTEGSPSAGESGKQAEVGNKQQEVENSEQEEGGGQKSDVNGQALISVAVVVQAMVQAEVAGIAFSVHPVTEDPNQIIIEAGYGLGEAVVSGQVTPDSYVVTKDPLEIIDKNISEQQKMLVCSQNGGSEWVKVSGRVQTNTANDFEFSNSAQKLSDEQVIELAKLITKIEQYYGTPQDIEWAWVADLEHNSRGGKFYITQSRPITTLTSNNGANLTNGEPCRFALSYSRDCSIILEQAWYKAQTEGFEELFGERNPHGPVNVYYINDGLLEIWENKNAVLWITKKLRSLVETDSSAVDRFIHDYQKLYVELNGFWGEEAVGMNDFIKCCDVFFSAVKEFARVFYIAVDEFAPKGVRAKALDLRQSDNLMDGMDGFIRQHLGHLAPHLFGIETLVLLDEVRESFQKLDENIVNRRLGWVVLPGSYYFLGSLESFSNLHPEFNFELIKKENVNYEQHLSGAIAYRGHTKGKVVLVNKKSEIEKVSSGDVLVSRMTIPDFIGAMKLASAIVTDEGGVTSHAAIISRELQKPCIIGTKIATQVLHDGDLVEVDADNGVVRVLERAG